MNAVIGELIVSVVAGGGLVVSGIVLLIVTNKHIAKYAIEDKGDTK